MFLLGKHEVCQAAGLYQSLSMTQWLVKVNRCAYELILVQENDELLKHFLGLHILSASGLCLYTVLINSYLITRRMTD